MKKSLDLTPTRAAISYRALILTAFAITGLSSAQQNVTRQTVVPPAAARQAGYTRLAFQEEFNDDSGIDMNDTRKPGFNFYPRLAWGNYTLPARYIKVHDGVLHLFNPENHAQADLFSAVKTGAGKYAGFAAGGGAYFEASIAFDPEYKKKNPSIKGFPAFWSNPVEHHFVPAREPYDYLEMDHLEYNSAWYTNHPANYFHALIKWTVNHGCHRDFVDPVYVNRMINTPADTDYNKFNTFAALWVPGPAGRVDSYFNNTLRRSIPSSAYPKLQSGDGQHFMVILGCGQWPIQVDWVRVWMAPDK